MFTPLLIGLMAATMQQTDTTVTVRPNARLELENFGGSILVKTWEKNQVRVHATHGRRDYVEVSATPSVVRIEADSKLGMAHTVDYEITVPVSMSVDLSGTYTSIEVQGVQGEVAAETVKGDVIVNGGSGRIRLESVEGKIVLTNARGRVDASTVNQGVHLTDVVGDLTVETVNGAIVLERVQAGAVDAATVNGTIVYDGTIRDGGDYVLSTHNGGIWVVVPNNANATVSVSTFNGKLDTSFNVNVKEASNRRRMSFVVGSGSAKLDLETFGGDVRLRRPGESLPTFTGGANTKVKAKNDDH